MITAHPHKSLVITQEAELPWVGKYFINFEIILQINTIVKTPNQRTESFLFFPWAKYIRDYKKVARAFKISNL